MRLRRLWPLLLPLWAACSPGQPGPPEIASPVKLARASVQPIARMVQAQGLVLRRGGGLVIEISASSDDSPLLRPGLSAKARDLQSGAIWACRVTDVLAHASLETGASVAWLEPVSGSGTLKEGDFISAEILALWLRQGLVVPSAAVLIHQGHTLVVVGHKDKSGAESFEALEVSVGVDSGEFTQVLKGLSDGDDVVVEGATGFLAPEFKGHPTD